MDIACFSVLSSVVIFFVFKLAKDDLSPEGKLLLTRLTDIIPRFEGDKAAVKSALFCGYIAACLLILARLIFV